MPFRQDLPILLAHAQNASERLGKMPSYTPNYVIISHLRDMLAQDDARLRTSILETEVRFLEHHGLTVPFPRHDFMDHLLPFEHPLNISQIHETFADLAKRASLNYIYDIHEPFPYGFLDETLLARLEFDHYDFYDDLEYVYEFAPQVWHATTAFYREIGREETMRIWKVACRLHYELRGIPYRDDYFGPYPTPQDGTTRCG
jgi:hypothetical protein